MIETAVAWLESTALNDWVLGSQWAWPAAEIIHFAGLCLLLGSLLIIDLGLIGVLRNLGPDTTHRLLRLVALGFGINLATGMLFIVGDPGRYFINISFQIKMLLVVLAGLNALWYGLRLSRNRTATGPFNPTRESMIIGVLSLLLWFGVLICGRMIPYVGTG